MRVRTREYARDRVLHPEQIMQSVQNLFHNILPHSHCLTKRSSASGPDAEPRRALQRAGLPFESGATKPASTDLRNATA